MGGDPDCSPYRGPHVRRETFGRCSSAISVAPCQNIALTLLFAPSSDAQVSVYTAEARLDATLKLSPPAPPLFQQHEALFTGLLAAGALVLLAAAARLGLRKSYSQALPYFDCSDYVSRRLKNMVILVIVSLKNFALECDYNS